MRDITHIAEGYSTPRLVLCVILMITSNFISKTSLSVRGSFPAAAVPRRPFPQHTTYAPGTIKPNNVPQQQLDDSVMFFYDRWKARYLKHDCTTDQYYVFDDEQAPMICVSEGQGYGMLITTIMAGYDSNAQTYFNGLYNFYRAHPSYINNRLMAWKENTGCITDSANGTDAATDGDMDIAFGLLLAHEQWGSGGVIDYFREANALITAIMQDEINHQTHLTKLGDWAMAPEPKYYYGTRTSDFMMDHFRIFAQATNDSNWLKVIDQCYLLVAFMQTRYSASAGLLPDFILHTNTTPIPAPPNYLEAYTDGSYSYNACRDPWRIATDYLMSGDQRAKGALDRLNTWVRSRTGNDPTQIWAGYRLDGGNVPGNQYNAESFTGPFAVSAMVDSGNQGWLNNLWTFNVSRYNFDSAFYYENTLKLLTMIVVSGNWWQPQFQRTIAFSGYRWNVKSTSVPDTPGGNYFSPGSENVCVDSLGQLHLRITRRNGRWYSSEIRLDTSLGYGRYVFYTPSRLDILNENAALGFSTWDEDSAQAHREIDIGFSRPDNQADTANALFDVQPWEMGGHLYRWRMPGFIDSSINGFNWQHDSVSFFSVSGSRAFPPYQQINASWKYAGPGIPTPGNEKAHINIRLEKGSAPSDSQEIEAVISKFEFNPALPPTPSTWQMVSLPRKVINGNLHILIPNALSEAFYFVPSSGYRQCDTLKEGAGYWVRLQGSAFPTIIEGDSIHADTVVVEEGWNLIGSISVPITLSAITSEPPALVTSQFYSFQSGYFVSSSIQPGRGYWVKVNQNGQLILSKSSSTSPANSIRIIPTAELPPPPPEESNPERFQWPEAFVLSQNYPNPFNPATVIGYHLFAGGQVRLAVYNLMGQEVARLVDEMQDPGYRSVTWNAHGLPAGVYFIQLNYGHPQTVKAVLIK